MKLPVANEHVSPRRAAVAAKHPRSFVSRVLATPANGAAGALFVLRLVGRLPVRTWEDGTRAFRDRRLLRVQGAAPDNTRG
jgi:hypothetical protein